jgi:hypothetical protein
MEVVRYVVPEFRSFRSVLVDNHFVVPVRYQGAIWVRQANKGKSRLVTVLVLIVSMSENVIWLLTWSVSQKRYEKVRKYFLMMLTGNGP